MLFSMGAAIGLLRWLVDMFRRPRGRHLYGWRPVTTHGCGGGAGGLSQLPGVPAGTCIPSQLHGIIDRHAMNAHCCSGLNGPGPAHCGPPGAPQIGSADAGGKAAKAAAAITSTMAAKNLVTRRRMQFMRNSDLCSWSSRS